MSDEFFVVAGKDHNVFIDGAWRYVKKHEVLSTHQSLAEACKEAEKFAYFFVGDENGPVKIDAIYNFNTPFLSGVIYD